MDLTGKIVKYYVQKPGENNGALSAPAIVVRDWNPELEDTDPNKMLNLKVLKDNEKNEWVTSAPPRTDYNPAMCWEKYKTNCCKSEKSLQNTTSDGASKNVKDIKFWGDGDLFKFIAKAHSKDEGWMKSTKAMEVPGLGCVVQVTTQQDENVAETLTFVPGASIKEVKDEQGNVISREVYQAGVIRS